MLRGRHLRKPPSPAAAGLRHDRFEVDFTPDDVPPESFRGSGLWFACRLFASVRGPYSCPFAVRLYVRFLCPYGLCDLTGEFCAAALQNSVLANAQLRSLEL
jgi:hypothetical protein